MTGAERSGFKRDPYARGVEMNGYPECNCIVRDPSRFPWTDAGFHPPPFNDLLVYQLHAGVFSARMVLLSGPDRHLKFIKPSAVRVAEYWGNDRWRGVVPRPDGMGFDIGYGDALANSIRDVIAQSARGAGARLDLDGVRDGLYERYVGFPAAWNRGPRVAALADSTTRVAGMQRAVRGSLPGFF